ncbi:hypothetical protein NKR23_g10186 [Pleurostoma richardsiae]|uniref:Uncharacterized protein n=1 Tax=Pleurostoma richardsiae TaxID=41990 RepID=A0AA38R5G9_9PEZI|nr:hypothetical protein NKR23_g10186 [Pleurostoma richardsiae]
MSVPPPLAAWHITSTVLCGPLEQEALYFYENVFGKLSPKTFIWSLLAVVLRYAFDDATTMHLLLAACLAHMSQQREDQATMRSAKLHFDVGSRLLVAGSQADQVDHCRSFINFWFLQLIYRAIWDEQARCAMKKLSASMAQYVQRYGLLDMLQEEDRTGGPGAGSGKPRYEQALPVAEKGFLARFLLFVAYEDLDSEFCDAGGALSSLILVHGATSDAIFVASQNSHAPFGPDYPPEELADDIARSKPLEMHFHANLALAQINQLYKQSNPSAQELRDVYDRLQWIRQQYANIFQLAETPCGVGEKLMTTTASVVANFKAVLVYCLRAMAAQPSLSGDSGTAEKLRAAKQDLIYSVGLFF